MIKKLIILLLIINFISTVSAQSIDSIYSKMKNAKTLLYTDANLLFEKLDKGGYIDSLYQFTVQSEQDEIWLQVLAAVSSYYYQLSDFEKSADLGEQALLLAKSKNDTSAWIDNLSLTGTAYQRMGKFDDAARVCLEYLRLGTELNDTILLSSAYNNLAALYLQTNRAETAKTYIDRAVELEQTLDRPGSLAIRYGIASEIYVKLNLLSEALQFIQKAYELDKQTGNELRIARRLSQMGDVYSAMKRLDYAEKSYLESTEILERLNSFTSLAINYKQLGGLYHWMGDNAKSTAYLKKSLELAQKTGNKYIAQLVYEKLYEVYKPIDTKLSLEYHEKYTNLKDSLYNEKINRQLSDYQVKYETAQKEAVINRQELLLSRQQYMIALAAGIIVVVILLAAIIFFYFTKYRRLALREQKLNRQKEKMISIISHDIKNPMVTLSAAMRVFDKEVDKTRPELKQQSHSMLTAVEQQLHLVENLLHWAKLQSGQWKCNPVDLDVCSVLDETEKQLKLALDAKRCSIVRQFPDAPVIASADRQMLAVILRNLLQNAIKYSYTGGRITVTVDETLSNWCITVADEGTGIDPQTKQSLFQWQAGVSLKGTSGETGTGIGLSICRELAVLCGGELSINDSPGHQGAAFSFTVLKPHSNRF